jgi:predicted aconitase
LILTPEQQALLDGAKGETMAKVVKTLVMYGDAFGAERMVPVTSKYGHTVISFGLKAIKPVYELYDQLLDGGLASAQKFTADPRPLDPRVPSSLLEDIVFKKIMYTDQKPYEEQLRRLGITSDDGYTCTCYLDEVGNRPGEGDVLSWAESSAVVYANSVLGARCNRNSGIIELMGSIAGFVPEFGLLTDEGRKASWIVEVRCSKRPEAQLLGSAVGMKVMEDVPYVRGLDQWLGTELDDAACAYLKDFGAATASNGAVGLYHVENLTPEAKKQGEALIREGAQLYVIDDAELERVRQSYPVVWKDPEAKPELCFIGCPHLSTSQLISWADRIEAALRKNGLGKVTVPTVFTASTPVLKALEKTACAAKLRSYGVILSYICPLMYMNNPLCKKKAVITCSNKLRTYTSARYYTEDEILAIITAKEAAK